jgi:hypothetical protein
MICVALQIVSYSNAYSQCKGLYQKRIVEDSTLTTDCDMVLMSFDSYYDYYFYKYQYNKIGDSLKYINKEIHVLRNKYKKYLDVNDQIINESDKQIKELSHNTEVLRNEVIKKDAELSNAVYELKRVKKQRNKSYYVLGLTGLMGFFFIR